MNEKKILAMKEWRKSSGS